tara:strand:- start:33640 stop:33885 length:246 start_codon:yes stop_codon:yes gene_type:complete
MFCHEDHRATKPHSQFGTENRIQVFAATLLCAILRSHAQRGGANWTVSKGKPPEGLRPGMAELSSALPIITIEALRSRASV